MPISLSTLTSVFAGSCIGPLSFFGFSFTGPQTIALVAIVGGLTVAIVVAIVALRSQIRIRQMWHETARLALEKGQPVPPMPKRDEELDCTPPPGVPFEVWQESRRAASISKTIKGGLVLLAIGAGLFLMAKPGGPDRLSGAIPALMGVALILSAMLDKAVLSRRSNARDGSPHA